MIFVLPAFARPGVGYINMVEAVVGEYHYMGIGEAKPY